MKTPKPTSNQLTLYCCMENDCGKSFITKFNLKRHVTSVHYKSKKFKCNYCFKSFSSKQNLDEHVFIHTGERPYICDMCLISFRQISQLSLHKRDHAKPLHKSKLQKKALEPNFEKDKEPCNFQEIKSSAEKIKIASNISYISLPLLQMQVEEEIKLPRVSDIISSDIM
ncbi:unnamed protein product [Blepharisma stoltei]|uniref:C2H2-type domain-containing protein n=1 Tax=Blepharisma stoltei TaxID=1481888 RepID=A0AAU9JL21_9CILI|nr:unnamed protein product [Blepharisma stoltei]